MTTRNELLEDSKVVDPIAIYENMDFSNVMWTICRRQYYPGAMADPLVRDEFNLQCRAFTTLPRSGPLNPDHTSLYQLGTTPPMSR
jgi:hypothetical protein